MTSTVLPPLRAFFTTTCLSMRSLSAATWLEKNMEYQILMIVQWQENFFVDKKNKIKENYLSYIRY